MSGILSAQGCHFEKVTASPEPARYLGDLHSQKGQASDSDPTRRPTGFTSSACPAGLLHLRSVQTHFLKTAPWSGLRDRYLQVVHTLDEAFKILGLESPLFGMIDAAPERGIGAR